MLGVTSWRDAAASWLDTTEKFLNWTGRVALFLIVTSLISTVLWPILNKNKFDILYFAATFGLGVALTYLIRRFESGPRKAITGIKWAYFCILILLIIAFVRNTWLHFDEVLKPHSLPFSVFGILLFCFVAWKVRRAIVRTYSEIE